MRVWGGALVFAALVGCAHPHPAPAAQPVVAAPTPQPAPLVTDASTPPAESTTNGNVAVAGSDRDAARRAYREALTAAERGDFETAARGFASAWQARPSVELAFNAGRMYERQADVDNALLWYARLLESNPPAELRADVTTRMASLRDYERRRREGFAQPPPARDALSQEAARWFARGTALYQRRQYTAALRAFEAANQFAQNVPELMFNLAVTHAQLGHDRDAVGAFRAYLSARPDAPDRADIEARIRRLQP